MHARDVARCVLAVALAFGAGGCSSSGDDSGAAGRAFFKGANCKTLTAMLDQRELNARIAAGNDPTASLRETAEFLESSRRRAPKVVAADVDTLADRYGQLAQQAGRINWAAIRGGNPATTVPASELGEELADARFSGATFRLGTYAGRFCGR